MSLQVCGGSPGPVPTGAWEAGRQGKALQEEDRPVLSSTCPFRVQQQGSSLTATPQGLRQCLYLSAPSLSAEGSTACTCESAPAHLSSALSIICGAEHSRTV